MKHNENQLFKVLKTMTYIFIIGSVIWAGGYAIGLFFSKDPDKRAKFANLNMIVLFIELFALLVDGCYEISLDHPGYSTGVTIIHIILWHTAISFIGSLIYVFWYISGGRKREREYEFHKIFESDYGVD